MKKKLKLQEAEMAALRTKHSEVEEELRAKYSNAYIKSISILLTSSIHCLF